MIELALLCLVGLVAIPVLGLLCLVARLCLLPVQIAFWTVGGPVLALVGVAVALMLLPLLIPLVVVLLLLVPVVALGIALAFLSSN